MFFELRQREFSAWIPWFLNILIVLLVLGTARQAVKRYSIQQETLAHQQEIASAQSQQRQLQELLEYVKSPIFDEEQARLKFNLAKPGEKLAIIPGLNNQPRGSTRVGESSGDGSFSDSVNSNFTRWWSYFFKAR